MTSLAQHHIYQLRTLVGETNLAEFQKMWLYADLTRLEALMKFLGVTAEPPEVENLIPATPIIRLSAEEFLEKANDPRRFAVEFDGGTQYAVWIKESDELQVKYLGPDVSTLMDPDRRDYLHLAHQLLWSSRET